MTAGREELLRLFIDQAPVAIAMFDRDMRYIATSRRWLEDHGLGDRDPRGMSHDEAFPGQPNRWRDVHRRALDGEVISVPDERFVRGDGSVRWLRWEARPWYADDGPGGVVVFSEDITEWKRAEERFRVVVESSPGAIVLVDGRGRIALVNQRAEALFGYRRDEMLGQTVEMLVPEDSRAAHAGLREAFLARPRGRPMAAGRDLFGRCKDGRVVPIEIGLAPIESEQGRLVVATITDITERKHGEAMRELAIRDPLTGLYNRRFLEESLDREISRAGRAGAGVGLVMIDLDRFKWLNDRFGHAAGDAALREVGHAVQNTVRAEDVPCRYGGDEFVIVMPGISLQDAMAKAAGLRERVRLARPAIPGAEIPAIGLSMGVAAFPQHGTTGAELLKSVDAALYRAKALGGDRTVAAA